MFDIKIEDVLSHWEDHKFKYQNNPHIPDIWKSGKHYIYYQKIKTKGWYFICDIDGDNLTVLGARDEQALTVDANDKYGKLEESLLGYISLQDYILECVRLGEL